MRDAMIDLGELSPDGRRRTRPAGAARPPRRYRGPLAALAVILLAALAGAAPTVAPARPTVVPARLADLLFVGADRFFLVSAGPDPPGAVVRNKVISTYGLPSGNLLSLTTVAVSGAILDVTAAGDTVLVSYQVDTVGAEATVALRAGTGTALWRRPARLLGVAESGGLVLLRENSPEVGDLHWYGIDLGSGAIRWHLAQPVRGYIAEAGDTDGFPRRLISVDLTGRLVVRDAVDGTIVAATTVPVPAEWARRGIALWPDRDLILLGDHRRTTAYALPDLTERWHAPVDLYSSYVGADCGDAVCLFSPRGGSMRVLDRATGAERWASNRWSYADRAGPYLLAGSDAAAGRPAGLGVLDARTGRVRGDFGPWRSVGPPGPDGTVIGLREDPGDDAVWYARLDPAAVSTRPLGVAQQVSGDCRTTPDVLICRRLDASVGIWRLSGR